MLADMYWLESCVSAYCHDNKETSSALELVERLSFHRPTASYLLGYSVPGTNSMNNTSTPCKLPFRPCRFQYVAKVVAFGETPDELLANMRQAVNSRVGFWVLGHETFEPLTPKVSPSMLMCAVSRLLPGEPLLDIESSVDSDVISYLIVETSTKLYLLEKLLQIQGDTIRSELAQPTTEQFRESWSKRPFHYSGAINLDVAAAVVNILSDILLSRATSSDCTATKEQTSMAVTNTIPRTIRLLDPTVGSGTFVALTAMVWSRLANVEVTGVDSNPKCAFGTVRNLMSLFSVNDNSLVYNDTRTKWNLNLPINELSLKSTATIHTKDSTLLHANSLSGLFDCAVTNLPWNRNTFEFNGLHGRADDEGNRPVEVSKGILQAVASVLKPRAPIVVISAEGSGDIETSIGPDLFDAGKCLVDLGFDILGHVSIPPTGYALPSSKKKRREYSTKKMKGRSNCQVFVALAPYE
ncbi:hypothetical protein HJC23_000653 [Cyclotella cryptica]|uniref:DNA methylase adenine-specific domain-containing protein n=1 Tax=Cyclotella cryptica TaxID=29204 RepID=A0ABD3Q7M8_9STRA|eukprot:CCRYP_008065-RA/>CCRYP_008065-RA protein AED:0.29 eAED:0.29 QI:0/-1/0/1/-1/1/1/0/467